MPYVLKDHPCYITDILGKTQYENGRVIEEMERPGLYRIEGAVASPQNLELRIGVSALLDTGNDITIINPQVVVELSEELGFYDPLRRGRRIRYLGDHGEEMAPLIDLAFIFPGGHVCSSDYGFIVPSTKYFDVADIWIGQDLLRKYKTTFDGIKGTVSIFYPR